MAPDPDLRLDLAAIYATAFERADMPGRSTTRRR